MKADRYRQRHVHRAALLWLLVLAACTPDSDRPQLAGGAGQPQPVAVVLDENGRPLPSILAEEQVLHRGNGDEPETLDPHRASGVPSSNILRDLFEGLTTEDAEGRIVPGAAQRWNISRDGLTYTFYLRRDGRWSNGDALLAEDFVWSFRRAASPGTASSFVQMLAPIRNAMAVVSGEVLPAELGVTALDEYTLQIELERPTPYFLGLLNHSVCYPVHRESLQEHGDAFSRPGNLVSNGAYQLNAWRVRDSVELVPNEHYWDRQNLIIERVLYYPFADQSTELNRYRAGELDWTDEVPSNLFNWLQQNLPRDLVVSPWLGSYFLGLNNARDPFRDNPDLRHALALAIDRDLLTEKVTGFGEIPAYAFVPAGIPGYTPQVPEWAGWSQAEREAEAQRLYQKAGYGENHPLRVEFRYNTSENNKKVALAVAAMWQQVLGLEVSLINEEWKVFLQNREQGLVTEVFRAGWISDYNDPFSFLELLHSEHGRNDYGYDNPSYDRLLHDASAERVPLRRDRLMQAAEAMMLADQPVIPLYTYVTKRLVRPTLVGWRNNIMDHHYSRTMYFVKQETASDNPDGETAAAEPAEGAEDTEASAEEQAAQPEATNEAS